MDTCNVLLTKPGEITSTEDAVKNVPLIHVDAKPGYYLYYFIFQCL